MAEMFVPNLGQTPDAEARRDAVHVAVAPVVAGQTLLPGVTVGLDVDGEAVRSADPIGIVDPFRTDAVEPGERFWLLLFPNTITGLRHSWTHPAFAAKPPTAQAASVLPASGNDSNWLPGDFR
jgi:hypothetical protein